ncbi:MAG: hypothetical protein ACD_70C00131G0002 [uncultured bacterium]|nr:MAG: hypothetical protein ACD_70C00131G0002 [uncultured bacterium]OGT25878.1 MAG: hypothetical protein A3B71_07470 [Gammaproteobacteria bacterium RIFCSPHIGHO2_02_FULL_42_43]OGT28937.1 MAG: hypothetical protein A2624_02585 [Gammaproteobacteria bacterium RIFCSPHIGHO2_01_FULL_42_8]OGT52262.1 MAG: hypothetical protein A3E54_01345 [Gammaproteobacteria bacterium RIFCSPHIGHO2_12_FULL_41_25]OGT61875.1 MAG: hypothetical protein A3I77_01285 [Gammaproteobacteria bacterium RIFCSPLOWO2_02_FULL_42_14]OGT
MKLTSKKIARVAMTAVAVASIAYATQSIADSSKCAVEKCYGIAKKSKNDCGTPRHACAAQSKVNGDKNDWMFVMKGNCDRIVGGSLTSPNAAKVKSKK